MSNVSALPFQDVITIARPIERGVICAKRLIRDGNKVSDPDFGFRFFFEARPVSSLADVHTLLAELETVSNAYIIRGVLKPELPKDKPHRRKGNLTDTRHHWMCLDFDEVEAPEGLDPTSPEAAAWLIRSRLPEAFHNAAFILKQSSSAGTMKAGRKIKAHIWFWLDEPRTSAELREWVKSVGADAALMSATQPHFCCQPVFVD